MNVSEIQIERQSVKDGLIKSYGHDYNSQLLDVELPSGTVIRFISVPLDVWVNFRDSQSKGQHFNQHIRGRFPNMKLERLP